MTATLVSFQALVQRFFEQHLAVERAASRNTVLAYRDALKLFLAHASERLGVSSDRLDHDVLDVEIVRSFLRSLETERRCGPRTRNHRLAAIKSFARYVASVAPEHLERCRRIRELRPASFEHSEPNYLEQEEVATLARATALSRRDRALIFLLYNTGARVQEVIDLDVGAIAFGPVPHVVLVGKGRKQRTCPLWQRTTEAIRIWLDERPVDRAPGSPLFVNRCGQRLSRSGVAFILRRLSRKAELAPRHAKRVTPHVLRHTTAMHLLQSGVDITTIAAWLGHAQLSTTHGYVQIDLRQKQAAIASAAALPALPRRRYPTGNVLAWLDALGRSNIMRSAPARSPTQSPPWAARSA